MIAVLSGLVVALNPDYIDIIRERIGQTPFDFGVTA